MAVAEAALNHLRERPTVLKRYAGGIDAEPFYQKRVPPKRPEWIETAVLTFYSVRPVADARVSTPLDWDEVPGCEPGELRIDTVPDRLAQRGDPSADIDDHAGSLEGLLALAGEDEERGLRDAPWPPHFAKQPGEPTRVQPSRARNES